MRVYLPATLPALARSLAAADEPAWPAGEGYAVTPGLREWYASGDSEELEYAAMSLAADASLRLLRDDPDTPKRRVVIAAELDPQTVVVGAEEDRASRGRVLVTAPVALARIAAFHVDHDDAVADVTAAVQRPEDAITGEDVAAHELLWYATQELDDVLRLA